MCEMNTPTRIVIKICCHARRFNNLAIYIFCRYVYTRRALLLGRK